MSQAYHSTQMFALVLWRSQPCLCPIGQACAGYAGWAWLDQRSVTNVTAKVATDGTWWVDGGVGLDLKRGKYIKQSPKINNTMDVAQSKQGLLVKGGTERIRTSQGEEERHIKRKDKGVCAVQL